MNAFCMKQFPGAQADLECGYIVEDDHEHLDFPP